MGDPTEPSSSESTTVREMPWVLISNQIQQLQASMNERFNDQRLRMDEQIHQLNERFTQVDQRLDKMDQRLDGFAHRLEFRMNTWLAIVLALLTAILGFFVGHG